MFTVVRHAQIPVPVTRAWQYLTEPPLLRQWFADTDRFEAGKTFVLRFGDGDFFVGAVREWYEPLRLLVEWRFMGLGPLFDITFTLEPLSESETKLTVRDRGAPTAEEAEALREGWDDFMSRLAAFARTGRSARYEWSQTLGLGAILRTLEPVGVPPELCEQKWWGRAFADAEVELAMCSTEALLLRFSEAAWGGEQTEARICSRPFESGTYLSLAHDGWTRLPPPLRMGARRRYAGRWREVFGVLEDKYRTGADASRGALGTAG